MSLDFSKIGILTSGGDAPGMNAAIRSLVRSAEFNNLEIIGIKKGFQGLIEGSFEHLEMRSVSNILGSLKPDASKLCGHKSCTHSTTGVFFILPNIIAGIVLVIGEFA